VRKLIYEKARFLGKRMFVAIARSINPPDLPLRSSGGERVQHRQDRRRTDAGA
jgi:hypothetical protein